jgi:hypothetical protein
MPKFTKGQSGNPGGRPKEVADIKALARAHTDVALSALVAIVKDKGASANARVAAASAILDRGYGKPAQAIEHGNLDNAPLVIRWLTGDGK